MTPTGMIIAIHICDVERTTPYTEIGQLLRMPPHWLSSALKRLGRDCEREGIPRLDAMVVRDDSGLPGAGFREDGVPMTKDEHDRFVRDIKIFGWGRIRAHLAA